jgi:hypothetical protein
MHTIGVYPTSTVPIVRDIANAIAPTVTGEGKSYGYKFSPIVSAVEKSSWALSSSMKAIEGEEDWDVAAGKILEASGYMLGLPTAQAKITGGYLADVISGEDVPEDFGEFMYNLAYRRQKE